MPDTIPTRVRVPAVDRNQKPMARAFVAELLGHLCTRMKHDLSPHTPRVLHALLKHLGDADARVREATYVASGGVGRSPSDKRAS